MRLADQSDEWHLRRYLRRYLRGIVREYRRRRESFAAIRPGLTEVHVYLGVEDL